MVKIHIYIKVSKLLFHKSSVAMQIFGHGCFALCLK